VAAVEYAGESGEEVGTENWNGEDIVAMVWWAVRRRQRQNRAQPPSKMNPTHTGGSILLRCLITAFLGHLYTPGVFLTNQNPDPIIPPDLLLSKITRGASATSGAPGLAPVLPSYEGVHNMHTAV
jgi:hypothetical protein